MHGGLPEAVRARALARLLERMEHGLSLILGETWWDETTTEVATLMCFHTSTRAIS